MDQIRILGGKRLSGTIHISGAKNAALPLMAASLLTAETIRLSNLPHLADISTMTDLLAQLGVEIRMDGLAGNGGHAGRVLSLRAGAIAASERARVPASSFQTTATSSPTITSSTGARNWSS